MGKEARDIIEFNKGRNLSSSIKTNSFKANSQAETSNQFNGHITKEFKKGELIDIQNNYFGSESEHNALDNTLRTADQRVVQNENWKRQPIFNCKDLIEPVFNNKYSPKEELKCESKSILSKNNSNSNIAPLIPAQQPYLWCSEDEDTQVHDSKERIHHLLKERQDYRNFNQEFEAQGLNGSIYESDEGQNLKMVKQTQHRERTYSDADRKPKRPFDLSQIKNVYNDWDKNFNLSMNAELGEAFDNKIEEAENEDEQQVIDDPDYFYSSKDVRKSIRKFPEFIKETSSVDSEKLCSSAGSVDIAEESKVIHNSLKSSKQLINSSIRIKRELIVSNISSSQIDKLIQKKYKFNIMLLGPLHIGKTTFMSSFFSQIQRHLFQKHSDIARDQSCYNPSSEFIKYVSSNKNQKEFLCESEGLNVSVIDNKGYDPYEKNNNQWIDDVCKELQQRHKRFYKMQQIYYEETNLSSFEFCERVRKHDKRIHLVLYFIQPFKPIKKFDIYAMMKIQKYAHIIPVIGKRDNMTKEELLSLKFDLISMAHINNVKFFDVYESLLSRMSSKEDSQAKYLNDDENGPIPPFSKIKMHDIMSMSVHAIKKTNDLTTLLQEDLHENNDNSRNNTSNLNRLSLFGLSALGIASIASYFGSK